MTVLRYKDFIQPLRYKKQVLKICNPISDLSTYLFLLSKKYGYQLLIE